MRLNTCEKSFCLSILEFGFFFLTEITQQCSRDRKGDLVGTFTGLKGMVLFSRKIHLSSPLYTKQIICFYILASGVTKV